MFKKSLVLTALAMALSFGVPVVMAGGGGGGFGGGGPGGGGMGGGGMGGGGMGGGGMGGGGMGGGGMGGGGMGGGRGAVDPATQVQNALTRIQTSLNMAAGDEWTVLAAKIQKVLEDQQKLAAGVQNPLQGGGRGGMGGGGMGGGGMGGGGMGGAPVVAVDTTNPLAVARDDLSKSVAAGATTADNALKTKVTTVRDQRKKLEDQLTTDQKALQSLCSVRQEAILVSMGVLN